MRRFYDAVQLVIRDVTFERNVTISLFEATIRVLGGLLSAHSLLEAEELEPVFRHREPKYDGQLLDLAYDLGVRLLPAFDTRTGIPVHRVNLMCVSRQRAMMNRRSFCRVRGGVTYLMVVVVVVLMAHTGMVCRPMRRARRARPRRGHSFWRWACYRG